MPRARSARLVRQRPVPCERRRDREVEDAHRLGQGLLAGEHAAPHRGQQRVALTVPEQVDAGPPGARRKGFTHRCQRELEQLHVLVAERTRRTLDRRLRPGRAHLVEDLLSNAADSPLRDGVRQHQHRPPRAGQRRDHPVQGCRAGLGVDTRGSRDPERDAAERPRRRVLTRLLQVGRRVEPRQHRLDDVKPAILGGLGRASRPGPDPDPHSLRTAAQGERQRDAIAVQAGDQRGRQRPPALVAGKGAAFIVRVRPADATHPEQATRPGQAGCSCVTDKVLQRHAPLKVIYAVGDHYCAHNSAYARHMEAGCRTCGDHVEIRRKVRNLRESLPPSNTSLPGGCALPPSPAGVAQKRGHFDLLILPVRAS